MKFYSYICSRCLWGQVDECEDGSLHKTCTLLKKEVPYSGGKYIEFDCPAGEFISIPLFDKDKSEWFIDPFKIESIGITSGHVILIGLIKGGKFAINVPEEYLESTFSEIKEKIAIAKLAKLGFGQSISLNYDVKEELE